jgi:large conductance mechanosensitive channel
MQGFIDFIRKGNLVQLAVAFVIGVAFAAVVTSFVTNIISPLLGLIGGVDFTSEGTCISGDCAAGAGVFLAWGAFLTAVITFLITALVVYFVVMKPYEALEAKLAKSKDEVAGPTEIELLTQIRHLAGAGRDTQGRCGHQQPDLAAKAIRWLGSTSQSPWCGGTSRKNRSRSSGSSASASTGSARSSDVCSGNTGPPASVLSLIGDRPC